MNKCKEKDCRNEALYGYDYCDKHIGKHLKYEQEQKEKDAEWFRNFANCYD